MSSTVVESAELSAILAVVAPVAERLAVDGHSLYLVGGVVRDLLLGVPVNDIDLTTSARPPAIKDAVKPFATALWTQGERFGTIGAEVESTPLEITTYRAEEYDPDSRKPTVTFGDDLETDLSRRDFSINAMAISVPDGALHDPFGGRADLETRTLRTPLDPSISFTDDPLRMMRAARFIPRFDLSVAAEVDDAVVEHRYRLPIVSRERVHDELERLLSLPEPRAGLEFLGRTGLLDEFVPGLSVDERDDDAVRERRASVLHWASELATPVARRAALLWFVADDAGWLRAWKYSTDDSKATRRLRQAVTSFLAGPLTPRTVRSAAALVGDEGLDEAAALASMVDGVAVPLGAASELLASVRSSEDLGQLAPVIGGKEMIEALGLEPGPILGRATAFLTQQRIERGPMSVEESLAAVEAWLADQ